jgi:hypothetical protein
MILWYLYLLHAAHLQDIVAGALCILNHGGCKVVAQQCPAALSVHTVTLRVDHLVIVKQVPASTRKSSSKAAHAEGCE